MRWQAYFWATKKMARARLLHLSLANVEEYSNDIKAIIHSVLKAILKTFLSITRIQPRMLTRLRDVLRCDKQHQHC